MGTTGSAGAPGVTLPKRNHLSKLTRVPNRKRQSARGTCMLRKTQSREAVKHLRVICQEVHLKTEIMKVLYFLQKEKVVTGGKLQVPRWRLSCISFMSTLTAISRVTP